MNQNGAIQSLKAEQMGRKKKMVLAWGAILYGASFAHKQVEQKREVPSMDKVVGALFPPQTRGLKYQECKMELF